MFIEGSIFRSPEENLSEDGAGKREFFSRFKDQGEQSNAMQDKGQSNSGNSMTYNVLANISGGQSGNFISSINLEKQVDKVKTNTGDLFPYRISGRQINS